MVHLYNDEKGNRLKSYAAPATVRLTTSQYTTVFFTGRCDGGRRLSQETCHISFK